MNPIKAFKKWFLNILAPSIEGSSKKNKDLSQKQRFRDLFKKRKSTLIVCGIVFCLLVFGIGKSFSFFTGLIVCSSFVVIFWSSFGDQLMGMFKFKKKKKWTALSKLHNPVTPIIQKQVTQPVFLNGQMRLGSQRDLLSLYSLVIALFLVFPAKHLSHFSSWSKVSNCSKKQSKCNQIWDDASNDLGFSKSQESNHNKNPCPVISEVHLYIMAKD